MVVSGARQTGKTHLLRTEFKTHHYVSLDSASDAEDAEESGAEFLKKHPPPCVLDEVQYAPKLWRHIKGAVDRNREQNGQYVLTGSQKFELVQGVSESLAGRAAYVELHSLSVKEIADWSGKPLSKSQVLEWMWMGGYPEVHAKKLDPTRYYADYVMTYLERDVRQLIQVRNLRDFDKFLRMLAIRTGQLLSLTDLATSVGVSVNTVRAWLGVLEASNVVIILAPYHSNLGKRLVKTPKVYFADTGLAAYLCGFRSASDLGASQLVGAFFETLMLGQVVRWHTNQGLRPQLYFFRDHEGHEVDFVIPVGERFKLFEVKWAEDPSPNMPGFAWAERAFGAQRILSKTVLVPAGGSRKRGDVRLEDAVTLKSLAK